MTFLKFIFAMFLSFLPGILGLIVAPIMGGDNMWYETLNVSVLTPAGWVFSGVWTVLYFFIGLALFFVMQTHSLKNAKDKTLAYVFFGINMVFNVLWSFAFFGAQMPEVALVILLALIINAIFMARAFYRINETSFWFIVPYILWLFFAFYLNGMIIYLN